MPELVPVPVDPEPEPAVPDPLPPPVVPAELPEPVEVPEPVPGAGPELPVLVPVDVPVPPLPVVAPAVDVVLPVGPPAPVVAPPPAVVTVLAGAVGSGVGNSPSLLLPTTMRRRRRPDWEEADALWAVEAPAGWVGEDREPVTASTVAAATRLLAAVVPGVAART